MTDGLSEPAIPPRAPPARLPDDVSDAITARSNYFWDEALATTGVAFFGKVQSRLWHYTGLSALHGIVSDQALWMTNIRYTNDLSELEHGFSILREVLAAKREHFATQNADYLSLLDEIVLAIERLGPVYQTYVTSLCESGDLLPQWVTYARRGGGVAIELDVSNLGNFFVCGEQKQQPPGRLSENLGLGFRRVEYRPDKQVLAVTRLLDEHLESATTMSGQFKDRYPGEVVRNALMVLVRRDIENMLHILKHPSLDHERECRLFAQLTDYNPDVRPFFRYADGYAVPYLKAKPTTGNLPITAVRVGRSTGESTQTRLNSADVVLRAYGYQHIVPTWYMHILRT